MMVRVVVGLLLVMAGLFVLRLMRAGWRHREERSAGLLPEQLAHKPSHLGKKLTGVLDGVYVSSTAAGDWLDRITSHDLGYRSSATVQVFTTGVDIIRSGARDVFIPTAALKGVRTEPGIAGKFVGGAGIAVLSWHTSPLGPETQPVALDTGLRIRGKEERTKLVAALNELIDSTNSKETQEQA